MDAETRWPIHILTNLNTYSNQYASVRHSQSHHTLAYECLNGSSGQFNMLDMIAQITSNNWSLFRNYHTKLNNRLL